MAKNSAYWSRRFLDLNNAQMRKAEKYFNDVQREYTRAAELVQKDIAYWYQRLAKNNEMSMQDARRLLTADELKEFKWTVEEYIEYGKKNALNPKWTKELENASAKYHISRLESIQLQIQQQLEVAYQKYADGMTQLADNIYTDTYYRSAYEIQHGINTGWSLAQLDRARVADIIAKPWAADGRNFSGRIWSDKSQLLNELQTGLTQMLIRGDAPDRLIKDIAKKFDVRKTRAAALIQTESAFFASAAQKDCFHELDVEQYEIVATLDLRTSEICQDMDGKVFDMRDFQPGSTAPPLHVRCRSVTAPYIEGLIGTRIARGADGKTYYVPDNMKYKEWKETFVDGDGKTELKQINLQEDVAKSDKNGIITLNRDPSRKEKNIGVFASLEIPMQKRKVLSIAREYGIDLKGITVKIQRNERLLKLSMCGSADYNDVGRIDLYPNAFRSEEELVRTLLHERIHVLQLKKYGKKYIQSNLKLMEEQAYRAETVFYNLIKKRKTYDNK